MLYAAAILLLGVWATSDRQLDRAVEKLRAGDPSAPGELIKLGQPAVRAVEPLLSDPKVEVRRGVVAVLAAIPGEESCRTLGPALNDSSFEIRGRAALAYYHQCRREQVPCDKLLAGVAKEDASVAAILLCGYCGEAAKKYLEPPPPGRLKLEAYGPVVSAALAAKVAKLRIGDSAQAAAIAEAAASKDMEETEFIVQALPVIPREHLGRVLALLDDQREARSLAGVPAGVQPRRICDAAADAFAVRLDMPLPFPAKPSGRYTPDQLQAAKSAVTAKLKEPGR